MSAGRRCCRVRGRPGPGGPTDATGLWYGPLGGQPARICDLVPDTNLAFAPTVARSPLAVQDDDGQHGDRGGPAPNRAAWLAEYRLPVFAEQVAWTVDGLVVLAAEPGPTPRRSPRASRCAARPRTRSSARAAAGWRRLWRVDAATGTAQPASPDDLAIWEFAAIPGGGAVVVASDDPTEAGWYHSRLIVLDADGQRMRVLRESPWQLSSPTVSPDGRCVAYRRGLGQRPRAARRRGAPGPPRRESGRTRPAPLAADADVTWLSWAADGRLWLAGWQHLGTAWGWAEPAAGRPRRMAQVGGRRPNVTQAEHGELPQLAVAPGGRAAARRRRR